ncbi:hypothetical protein FOM74_22425 [Salmonella enterica]|nr:hypothetical protein [Salmonella enterica]
MNIDSKHHHYLAVKHDKINHGEYEDALKYIDGMQKGILKELKKLEDEYTDLLKKSDKADYVNRVERNYSHWRHVLVSVFEPLEDAKAHWHYHARGLTGENHPEPRHKGQY